MSWSILMERLHKTQSNNIQMIANYFSVPKVYDGQNVNDLTLEWKHN